VFPHALLKVQIIWKWSSWYFA